MLNTSSDSQTSIDFFLWGFIKEKVYDTKAAIVRESRSAIERLCTEIPNQMIRSVCDSIALLCQQCLDRSKVINLRVFVITKKFRYLSSLVRSFNLTYIP